MSSTNLVKKSSVSKLYERIEEENTIDEKIVERTHKVTKVDKRILLKALRKFPVYEFSRLKSYFPLLKSHSNLSFNIKIIFILVCDRYDTLKVLLSLGCKCRIIFLFIKIYA